MIKFVKTINLDENTNIFLDYYKDPLLPTKYIRTFTLRCEKWVKQRFITIKFIRENVQRVKRGHYRKMF